MMMYQPVDYPWNDGFDFAAFRQQVGDFAELLGTAQLRSSFAFRWELITHLARLYASGTQMPPYSPFMPDEADDGESVPDAAVDPRKAKYRARHIRHIGDTVEACMGDDDAYHGVTWPDEDTVEKLTLSGELAWIYSDLLKGAEEWDQGRLDDAASTWVYGFEEGDWGPRCLSVLGCLHFYAGDRMSLLVGSTSEAWDSVSDQDAASCSEVSFTGTLEIDQAMPAD
ncbi:MAG: DUF5063 domain-containing protein [Coriobacteriia bacterium]|nr:DUF5063 domain-containing protein [Coriobacteriia bacterium]